MATAVLPMYDLPELHAATDAWWAGIARALRRAGIEDVPVHLTRGRSAEELWQLPDLLLAQVCGSNIVGAQAGRLTYVATPRYSAPGCAGPLYSSHIVVPATSAARTLDDLRGARCVINSYASHSGCNAIRGAIAPLAKGERFFSAVAESGGHALSLAMLAEGKADVAAIDCVVFALLARHRPPAVAGVRIIGQTASAPVGPYVARIGMTDDALARLRAGLMRAMDDPELAAARADLLIGGFEILNAGAYDRIMQIKSAARGYQDFERSVN